MGSNAKKGISYSHVRLKKKETSGFNVLTCCWSSGKYLSIRTRVVTGQIKAIVSLPS
jgi:hypothetical protein